MGNQVGVCREPPQLAELFPLRDEPHNIPNGDHANGDDGYRSYIQMWRFYSDGGDDMFIKNSPVKLGAFKKFDSRDCYIALHIFKNYYGDAKHNTLTHPPHDLSSPHSSTTPTPYSLQELVLSSLEELTPRGIASSFGTLTLEPFIHTSREEYTHDLYVWNGKASTPLAKAVALAKGFEIERVLVKEKITGTVYRRFARGAKSSLSSLFKDDIAVEDGKHAQQQGDPKRFDVNHLVRQLVHPYKRTPSIKIGELFGSHTEPNLAARFEVLKKSMGQQKFEPGVSSPPGPLSPSRKHPKVPALSLSALPSLSQQQQMDDATPRPRVPPIFGRSITEGSLTSHIRRATPSLSFENLRETPDDYVEGDYSTWEPSRVLNLFEPRMSQILDFLFLSSRIPTADKLLLRTCGVTHILNCAGSVCTNHFPDDFVYKTYFISDSSGEDIMCLFYETIDFIEDARQKGGKVLIHCHQGVSRSSSFVILYLMWQFRWDFNKAHEWVRAIRYISNPNPGFTGQLILWFNNMQKLPPRPRLNAIPPPTNPPQPLPIVPQEGQWNGPLATPRNLSSRYEPIATPRGARTTDPSPTPRTPTPSSPTATPRTSNPSSPMIPSIPLQSVSSLPNIPALRNLPPFNDIPIVQNIPTIPPIPTILPTYNIPVNFALSIPTPGEPPPNLRSNSDTTTVPMIPTLYIHQPKTLTRTASDPTPSSSPPPIPPPVKLYRLVSHSQNAFVVPKQVTEPLTARSLDPRGCFILCVPGTVFLWYGVRCSAQLVDNARRVIEKLQRYECASNYIEDTRQGFEPTLFWSFFSGGAGEVMDNVLYNREYSMIASTPSPGRREQQCTPQGSDKAELFKHEDTGTWEKYDVFDEEDLDAEGIFVLHSSYPRHVWVWIGCDYTGKMGVNGEAVDGLLLARQFRNDMGLPDEGNVTIIKSVGQETDEFLSHFH